MSDMGFSTSTMLNAFCIWGVFPVKDAGREGRGGHVKSPEHTLDGAHRGLGSYLDGVVELLQRTSGSLPAADVHTEGVPPHD